ncbi:MAG: adenylyltransferase/cytidyltransferase family protein [Acidobacteriota bacterium]
MGVFYTRKELVDQRATWRATGKTVVFTNGCYDILHPGHIRLLERARSLGDLLILALNTDDSVARLKGPTRPLMSEEDRAAMALALESVDAVTFFDEDTPRELISVVLPDILIKGADWAHFIARTRRGGSRGRQSDGSLSRTGISPRPTLRRNCWLVFRKPIRQPSRDAPRSSRSVPNHREASRLPRPDLAYPPRGARPLFARPASRPPRKRSIRSCYGN